MIDTSLAQTLTFPLIAGIATFFSPCAYPLLPGYVGYYVSQTEGGEASLGGSLARGAIAGGGVLVTLAILLGAAVWIGYATIETVVVFEPIVGLVLLAFGLLIVFDRAPSLSLSLPRRRSSVLGFGIFGAGYALAAAGCVAPLFIGVVTYAVSLPTGAATLAVATYVGTVATLMIALTVATGMGLVAGAGTLTAYSSHLKRLAGVVMIVAGLGQLYLAIFVLNAI